ncbi:hypothetical protein JTB14_022644 [Gonioctena quinquepunctata]|nr:hypothetical protein JTB14_022644 [Gonioctena quinquepunctata]
MCVAKKSDEELQKYLQFGLAPFPLALAVKTVAVRKRCSGICKCCHGDSCRNSAEIVAGYGEEEDDDAENEDLIVAELLPDEVKVDNEYENLEDEERN